MSTVCIYSAQVSLLDAHIIDIEVDLSRGLHTFSVVGLPDKAVEEARDRIAAAIKNTGFTSPKQKNHKIVISLAPAELKKEGSLFDVGMALGYLLASEAIRFDPKKKLFLGELSLTGDIRPARGTLLIAQKAKREGFTELYVPRQNAEEAALIKGITVYAIDTLFDLINHLDSKGKEVQRLTPISPTKIKRPVQKTPRTDLGDIRGQENAKRALLIAAAGRHNVAFYGPPGTGKTLLARALAGILPPLSFEEALEVTGIHSASGILEHTLIEHPPFRSPHHTASHIAIIGGGAVPKPGEATLAHRGVLFLDEFPEFDRRVIESLREPLEERFVSIARARGTARFPAHFILVASLNPCPCGNWGSEKKTCRCRAGDIERYRRKLSGPIIDRIDMWVEVSDLNFETLSQKAGTRASEKARKQVMTARKHQRARYKHQNGISENADLGVAEIDIFIHLDPAVQEVLKSAMERLSLSPRAYHRIIKLARTIADLESAKEIGIAHMLEAIQYRPKSSFIGAA